MSRALLTVLVAALCSPTLFAQSNAGPGDDPIVVEMTVERSLAPDHNGVADILDGIYADKLVLTYILVNDTTRDLEIAPRVTLSDEANCTAFVSSLPAEYVAAGERTTMIIEVEPHDEGPFSFHASMLVGQDEYGFDVKATIVELKHGDEHHCHWWGCHSHHHHDHHCSTTADAGIMLAALFGVVLLTLGVRRFGKAFS